MQRERERERMHTTHLQGTNQDTCRESYCVRASVCLLCVCCVCVYLSVCVSVCLSVCLPVRQSRSPPNPPCHTHTHTHTHTHKHTHTHTGKHEQERGHQFDEDSSHRGIAQIWVQVA